MSILPLKGIYYNPEKIKKLHHVVCPPYDLITPEQIKLYQQKSPFNVVNLILRKPPLIKEYKKVRKLIKQWIECKVLKEEQKPCIYPYCISYNYNGEKKELKGFIGLFDLRYLKNVYAHEKTYRGPKEDRFKLMKASGYQLSPVYLVSINKNRKIQNFVEQLCKNTKPISCAYDNFRCLHRLYKIETNSFIQKELQSFKHWKFLIADGHHRFSSALKYREFIKNKLRNLPKLHPANYILCFFSDLYQEGLVLDTFYRGIIKNLSIEDVLGKIKKYFDIQKLSNLGEIKQIYNYNNFCVGMAFKGNYYILHLKKEVKIKKFFDSHLHPLLKIDTFILHNFLFEKVLNWKLKEEKIIYSPEWKFIKNFSKNYPVFIPRYVRKEIIPQIVKKGLLFPHKSTYFFPKLLSGLIIRRVENGII